MPPAPAPIQLTSSYRIEHLHCRRAGIAAALGLRRRFHLAGHDWGGSLAWQIADQIPNALPR